MHLKSAYDEYCKELYHTRHTVLLVRRREFENSNLRFGSINPCFAIDIVVFVEKADTIRVHTLCCIIRKYSSCTGTQAVSNYIIREMNLKRSKVRILREST